MTVPFIFVMAGILLVIVGAAALAEAHSRQNNSGNGSLTNDPLPSPIITTFPDRSGGGIPVTGQNSPELNQTTGVNIPPVPVGPEPTISLSSSSPAGTPSIIATIYAPATVQGRKEIDDTGISHEMPVLNTTSLAVRIHDLINKQRQEHGLPDLRMDPVLTILARAHSEDMAGNGYFGHVNLQEMDPTARGAAVGFTCRKNYDTYYTYGIAENIFATYRYGSVVLQGNRAVENDWKSAEDVANETVDAWMNSPDHRANILDEGMLREGIGVAEDKNDLVFVTEDFC